VLLLSVILASFGVLLLQRNMVVESDGTRQVHFPWQEEADTGIESADVETTPDNAETTPDVETVPDEQTTAEPEPEPEPEQKPAPEIFHVYPVQATPLSLATYDEISWLLRRNSGYNAVSVCL